MDEIVALGELNGFSNLLALLYALGGHQIDCLGLDRLECVELEGEEESRGHFFKTGWQRRRCVHAHELYLKVAGF